MLLHLYPRSVRERHGEDMRQAFRDRCREVSDGRTSAWRLFCLEMAPDLATSVGGAHLDVPGTPRMRASLLALAVLAGMWLFHDALSSRVLDAWFAAKLRWVHWQENRAFERDEARIRALADHLATSSSEHERSLAAYLYAINFASRGYAVTYAIGAATNIPFQPLVEDGERANRLIASLSQAPEAANARIALSACLASAGCDRLPRAQALVRVDPRNAYGWSELLSLHTKSGDEVAAREDLRQMARAGFYDDGQQAIDRALAIAAMRFAPGDAGMAGALGRQLSGASPMRTEDLSNHVMIRCALLPSSDPGRPRWLQQHPEARADCRGAALVFARARSDWEMLWGWSWLDRDQSTPQTQAGRRAAREQMLASSFTGSWRSGDRHWQPWTDARWLAWAQAQGPSR
jgi:hypothetical protein